MTANLSEMFGAEQTLPPCPEGAMLIGSTFIRLGGYFSIGGNGSRYVGKPLYCNADGLPQLPDAEPHERFHSRDEWEGAIKLLEGLIHRLHKSDASYLFDAFAPCAFDPRNLVPSIEEPTRRPQ